MPSSRTEPIDLQPDQSKTMTKRMGRGRSVKHKKLNKNVEAHGLAQARGLVRWTGLATMQEAQPMLEGDTCACVCEQSSLQGQDNTHVGRAHKAGGSVGTDHLVHCTRDLPRPQDFPSHAGEECMISFSHK